VEQVSVDGEGAGEEFRIYGPPGCGKTTYLSDQIAKAAHARGSDNILVASFTKAAAMELTSRDLPLLPKQIGTLHAIAYRQMDRPTIANGELDEWNSEYPALAMKGGAVDVDHSAADATVGKVGDSLMNQSEILRAREIPVERWPSSLRSFWSKWTEFKELGGYMDFTDLIQHSLDEGQPAPGNPRVGFFDEVQDFTPLELRLVRMWGSHMDQVLLAGDDDQCIYSFKGSSPEAFLEPPVDEEHRRILSQSYRVPVAVHAFASSWVEQLKRRQEKPYAPRDAPGHVDVLSSATWRNPNPLLDRLKADTEAGRTSMILATCSFMLDPIRSAMRREGLLYHNPYRRRRGDWNPISKRADQTSAADRLLAMLRWQPSAWGDDAAPWTFADANMFVDMIKSAGTLRRGAKTKLNNQAHGPDLGLAEVPWDWLLEHVFKDPEDLNRAAEGDLRWLRENLTAARSKSMEYVLQVAEKHGGSMLLQDPTIVLGTIHSVKGGEADVVYMFPDLSRGAMREWLSAGEDHDAVVRQMYVGMTRARTQLVMCGPADRSFVDATRYLPTDRGERP
jgi:DNA helicase-2/ATP-dependent DNA helicase PcrA